MSQKIRDYAYGEFGDVPCRICEWMVLRTSRVSIFQHWQNRGGSGCGLCRTDGYGHRNGEAMAKAVAYLSLSLQPKKQGGENQFTALFVVSLCVKAAIQMGANAKRSDIYASGLYKPIQFPLGSRNIAKAPLPSRNNFRRYAGFATEAFSLVKRCLKVVNLNIN